MILHKRSHIVLQIDSKVGKAWRHWRELFILQLPQLWGPTLCDQTINRHLKRKVHARMNPEGMGA